MKKWLEKFAVPSGMKGRFALAMMNFCHTPLSKWGLSHCKWRSDMKLLDIGCGGGANLKRLLKLCSEGSVEGIDISEESVRKSRKLNCCGQGKRCRVLQADAAAVPCACEEFDVVTAFETIYFFISGTICRHVLRKSCAG